MRVALSRREPPVTEQNLRQPDILAFAERHESKTVSRTVDRVNTSQSRALGACFEKLLNAHEAVWLVKSIHKQVVFRLCTFIKQPFPLKILF